MNRWVATVERGGGGSSMPSLWRWRCSPRALLGATADRTPRRRGPRRASLLARLRHVDGQDVGDEARLRLTAEGERRFVIAGPRPLGSIGVDALDVDEDDLPGLD